ncbi:site-specific integrase [Nonomuraea sp. NBC_00507]|uniref:tyrosine-type recombinase/integrase n=1 Tax=Nonomuraea sp. NBC_00507 TaxID=2976002 RepID=UPI002E181ED0
MRVQRVLMPDSEEESWTVLDDDQVPIEPVEQFLAFLTSIEKSPNTVKAYAHDLKDWFAYLHGHRLSWRVATLEDVAGFVAWLRLPPETRTGNVTVLPTVAHHCSAASVNRKLSSLTSFCEFHARHGDVELAGLLITMQPGRRRGAATSFKSFLHHVTKGEPERRGAIKLKSSPPRPKVLTAPQAQAVLDACEHLRDRLLFAVLLDCGLRIGEALGLRHEDMGIADQTITVTPRSNANRARAKAGISRTIPASAELMRLYADYLTREYGALDSDYVFVNLFAEPYGRPWAYPAVYDLVLRLRRRTGIDFEPHQYRHTYATWLLRRGAGMESVKELLGHASITTTIDTYGTSPSRTPAGPSRPRAGSPDGRSGYDRRIDPRQGGSAGDAAGQRACRVSRRGLPPRPPRPGVHHHRMRGERL